MGKKQNIDSIYITTWEKQKKNKKYEMTEQFLWFQLQMNSYSSNWNTPY